MALKDLVVRKNMRMQFIPLTRVARPQNELTRPAKFLLRRLRNNGGAVSGMQLRDWLEEGGFNRLDIYTTTKQLILRNLIRRVDRGQYQAAPHGIEPIKD